MIKNHDIITVGSRIRITKPLEMHDKTYPVGHEFTVIEEDSIRGFDIKDDDGNTVYETRFIGHTFELVKPAPTPAQGKILRIALFLSAKGFSWYRKEWDCEEKPTTYWVTHTDERWKDVTNKRIDKNNVFKLHSNVITAFDHIEYNMWVFPDREEEAKKVLMAKVIDTAANMHNILSILMRHIADEQSKSTTQTEHTCKYSKCMDQEYPRKCVICGKPEITDSGKPWAPVTEGDELVKKFWEKTADLLAAHRKDGDERAAQGVVDCRILISRLVREQEENTKTP